MKNLTNVGSVVAARPRSRLSEVRSEGWLQDATSTVGHGWAHETRLPYIYKAALSLEEPQPTRRGSPLTRAIHHLRSESQLDKHVMAHLLAIDVDRLTQIEGGDDEPTLDELDAFAQILGVRMDQLTAGHGDTPLVRLFSDWASADSDAAMIEFAATGAQGHLGEFVRCLYDIVDLTGAFRSSSELPRPPATIAAITEDPLHGADRLADWLRAELDFGDRVIPSMRELVEKLGIHTFWTTPEELDPQVDAISASAPIPAILVNLVAGGGCFWRTRRVLAHQLCHLLCDLDTESARHVLFCPRAESGMKPRWELRHGFTRIEHRAEAFAACLLAPHAGVRLAVAHRDPSGETAIEAVREELGVDRTTAITRIEQVFGLGESWKRRMAKHGAWRWEATGPVGHPDEVREGIGLRSGMTQELTLQAVAAGRISRVRARECLGLSLTEPLPPHDGLTEEQRAPLRRREDSVQAVVDRYLEKNFDSTIEAFAGDVRLTADGWVVEVRARQAGSDAAPVACGEVEVSHALEVVEPRLRFDRLTGGPR